MYPQYWRKLSLNLGPLPYMETGVAYMAVKQKSDLKYLENYTQIFPEFLLIILTH